MRVLSATKILIKSAPFTSWDGIESPGSWLLGSRKRPLEKFQKGRFRQSHKLGGEPILGGETSRLHERQVDSGFLLRRSAYHQKAAVGKTLVCNVCRLMHSRESFEP